jgi:hypothetical protein
MQLRGNASVMYRLDEENSSHGSETKGTVHRTQSRGSTLLVAAGLLLGLGALGAGVLKLTLAVESALDKFLLLEVLVEGARVGDVIRRLDVEGTLDGVKLGCRDPTEQVSES